jgi:hypothetical protein
MDPRFRGDDGTLAFRLSDEFRHRVISARAGIQLVTVTTPARHSRASGNPPPVANTALRHSHQRVWIPAFAGMTKHQELARAEMRMDSRFRGDDGTLAFRLSDKFRHRVIPAQAGIHRFVSVTPTSGTQFTISASRANIPSNSKQGGSIHGQPGTPRNSQAGGGSVE